MDSVNSPPTPKLGNEPLISGVDRLALLIALTIALVLPLGYAAFAYRNLDYRLDTQAQVKAGTVTALISGNPKFWRFQLQRIGELLADLPAPLEDEAISTYDADGARLVSVGNAPRQPLLQRTQPLYDSGRVVGRVEVQGSLRGLIYGTALAAMLGLLLAGAVHGLLRAWPRRALLRMSTKLEEEHAALSASEERLRKLFDHASEGIMLLTPEGKLIAANESFVRMHGYSMEETLELNLQALDTPETLRHVPERMRRILGGAAITFEAEHYRKDGSVFPLEVSASLIHSDGTPMIQAFHRDISERTRAAVERDQLEEQLRQSQKMEALGTLAGGVAHDFNNALATIFGNIELARQDLGSGHTAQESLEEIAKATRRAKALVQQILAFGRRQPLQRKRISLEPIVVESARLLRSTLPAGIETKVVCAPDAPQVMADATQVQQILLNLGTNAWQAIKSVRGHGQASTGLIEILLEACYAQEAPHTGPEPHLPGRRVHVGTSHCARLTVRDNGPGMDAAIEQRIFEPFFTTKPKGEGSGLGLSVVHGIVQRHEASIEVQTAPGAGTSFCIHFPAAPPGPAAEAESSVAPEPDRKSAGADKGTELVLEGGGKRIMYIDDDEAIVFLMTRLLERKGYRVRGYTDGHEALAAARAHPSDFDLAVSDYNMPGMSGLELARSLHALRADLPVVIASGDITDELRAGAPAAGVRELIYKPNTVDELSDAISRLARKVPA